MKDEIKRPDFHILLEELDTLQKGIQSLNRELKEKGSISVAQTADLNKMSKQVEKMKSMAHDLAIKSLIDFRSLDYKYVYSGSFDPFTKGHLSLIKTVLSKEPDVNMVVLVAVHPDKNYTFNLNERKFIVESSLPEDIRYRIRVDTYDGKVPDYAYEQDIPCIIKGVRNNSKDAEYEVQLATFSSKHISEPMTAIVPQTDASLNDVSSSALKTLNDIFGIPEIGKYAPAFVREALKMKRSGKLFVGVTGGIASGKSRLCSELAEYSKDKHVKIHHLSMDSINDIILTEKNNPDYQPMFDRIRGDLVKEFGYSIMNLDGTISKKALGDIVFGDNTKLNKLTDIMLPPTLHLMSKKIESIKDKGIVLIESAVLLDRNLTYLVDENLIHVFVDKETQLERMQSQKGHTFEQANKRVKSQLCNRKIQKKIKENHKDEFQRIHMQIETSKPNDVPNVYNKLEREYLIKQEVRRYEKIFIPSDLTFNNEKEFMKIIIDKHSEKHRHYHNLEHLEDVLVMYQKYKEHFDNPLEVFLALLFHDIVYDIGKKEGEPSNEQKSSALARELLSKYLISPKVDVDMVCMLIELSEHHGSLHSRKDELSKDEELFLDIDMSILAAHRKRLMGYEEGVYQENKPLCPSREFYCEKRIEFLKRILEGKEIFLSDLFKETYEEKAIENIEHLIDYLSQEK